MNLSGVAKVLAKVKLGDNREVNEMVVLEWRDTIGHLDFADTIAAVVMFRQESTEYLVPAHLVANVKRIRQERAEKRESFELLAPQGKSWRGGETAPKPNNFEAMVASYGDPEAYRVQCEIYNRQLFDGGYQIDPEYGVA